ncbi:MAG TPA: DUF3631 domain-containing protein [Micromonosporaceae bacterium]
MSVTKLSDMDRRPNGAALLDGLRAALVRYIAFPTPEAADALTLWIAATHGQDAWEHAPRCAVVSPEKRCGKSRVMDVAEATCRKSLVTVNISPAALVREVTDEDPPTLFIDEADTIFGPKAGDAHEDLRGIVNSGHQRGRPYIRYDITTRSNEHLATFAMAMLAGIGDLPDTIMDRSIVVRMRRRAPGEKVAPYRTRRDRPALHQLRDKLTDWIQPNIKHLTDAEPNMPVEDRAADTWEPLVAVADLAGGQWPKRARRAALKLTSEEHASDAEASLGARLLADIRDTFAGMPHVGFLPSAEVVTRLHKIEDAPWRETDLTARGLAMKLKPYGIKPSHNSAKTARGYHLDDFADAFARYLSSGTVQPSEQAADQGEQADTCTDTSSDANRPDTSAVPNRPGNRPGADQGKQPSSDAWTDTDGHIGTCGRCGFPYDSNGHVGTCEREAA